MAKVEASPTTELPQYGDSISMAPGLNSHMAIVGCSSVTGNQWDGQLCLVDVSSGRLETSLMTYGGNCVVTSLQFNDDAYFFSGGDDGAVYCWNYRSVLASREGETGNSSKRAKTEDNQSKTDSSTQARPMFNLYDHQNIVTAVSCRSTEVGSRNHVLSSSWDATVKLWDIEAPGWPVRTFSTGREAYDVHWDPFSPHCFISGSRQKQAQLWDTRSKDATTRVAFDSAVKVARYNSLKAFEVAIGTQGGTVQLFDFRDFTKPISVGPPCGAINDIQFSPACSSLLAVAADDGRVRMLESGSGPGLSVLVEKLVHEEAAKGVTWVKSALTVHGEHVVASVAWDSTLKLTTMG